MKLFRDHDAERRDSIVRAVRGRTLDMGCTSSEGQKGCNLHDIIKETRAEVVGVDICGNPDVRHDLNVFPYPFEDESFDTIVAGYIIDHILHPFRFLEECNRILKAGGMLVITLNNAIGLIYILDPAFSQGQGTFDVHHYCWTLPMLESLLDKAGFAITEKRTEVWFWNRNLLLRAVAYIFPRLRPIVFITAKKQGV